MNKVRINITLNKLIHEKARYWCQREDKSLSETIEGFLKRYVDSKSPDSVGEMQPNYHLEKPLQADMLRLFQQLSPSKQLQLLDFATFLNSKAETAQPNSIKDIWKDSIWISNDFDAPLEDFKEYMP